jgi:hypothetical protein
LGIVVAQSPKKRKTFHSKTKAQRKKFLKHHFAIRARFVFPMLRVAHSHTVA